MKESLIDPAPKENRSTTLVSSTRVFTTPLPLPSPYKSNKISTSKYNCLTFLPKNLWEQFHKLANVYFLILATLQSIPDISNSSGVPSILLPLSIVLTMSAIKDLIEDNKRKRSDNEENNRKVLKRVNGDWHEVKWQSVLIGDILKVRQNEFFAADLVLLLSSDPKGLCYVETKNLDGETNLKHKLAEKLSQSLMQDASVFDHFQCEVKCDDPNPMIYAFSGLLKLSHNFMALGYEQLLLRGSSLKNTEWVVGICVYTGHQTKIMLNSPKSRAKYSNLEKGTNRQIVIIFILQWVLCAFCAGYYTIWVNSNDSDTETYLELKKLHQGQIKIFILNFFCWVLLFGNFVPISLLVTLEIVKFIQAAFISSDLDMYYEPIDVAAGVQSSNLNEDLGQISYIFSDKTGTLTCNVMEFKKISINGVSFGTDAHVPDHEKLPHVDFVDPKFRPLSDSAQEFLLHLAVCHTILCEEKDGKIEYKASSPDELALVNAARFFGVEFVGRDENQCILVKVHGEIRVIEVLNVIEFNSDRKRMTILIRLPNGQVKLYIKGADSVILPLITSETYKFETIENLESYANQGLRTLVLASKDLSVTEYGAWNEKYQQAVQDIQHKEKKIALLAQDIEKDLKLIGATAIEDKLQDQVPETIKILRDAGIKVWVLTGDKVETAVNIGFSCNLLTNEMLRITIIGEKSNTVELEIDEGLASMKETVTSVFALVVSGEALLRALKPEIKPKFLKLAEKCSVVLACRVSPQQKADIVKMIRDAHPKIRTLSIGDGANDVNMITAAHVGIGLAGLEGKQAVRASDYSIAQFSFLRKLILMHGRECYRRNANLICYNFYKNVLLILPLFYVGTISVFSAQVFYNTWVLMLFNFLFSAVPVAFYAVFDREYEKEELVNKPEHYKIGLLGQLFSTGKFWVWILEGAIQSGVVMFGTFFTIGRVSGLATGQMSSLSVMSVIVFEIVVIMVNLKVFLFSHSHFWFTLLPMFVDITLYFVINAFVYQGLPLSTYALNFDGYGALGQIFMNPNTYIWITCCVYACFIVEPVIKSIIRISSLRKGLRKVNKEDEEELFKSELVDKRSVIDEEERAMARSSIARYSQRRNF